MIKVTLGGENTHSYNTSSFLEQALHTHDSMSLLTSFPSTRNVPSPSTLVTVQRAHSSPIPQEETVVSSHCCDIIYTFLLCNLNNNQTKVPVCYIKSLRAGTACALFTVMVASPSTYVSTVRESGE